MLPVAYMQNMGLLEFLVIGFLVFVPIAGIVALVLLVTRKSGRQPSTLGIRSEGGMLSHEDIPLIAQKTLARMSHDDQLVFMTEFSRRKREPALSFILWFFGFHYAYFRQWVLFVIFVVMCIFIIGIVWWIVDLFRIPSMRRAYNQDLALEILKDMKSVGEIGQPFHTSNRP